MVTAFDAFAADYDADFTDTRLGRLLRGRVWQVLAGHFRPGDHVLELTCGTGEDAVWLAQRGVRVTATDASPAMLRAAQTKARRAGVDGLVTTQLLSLQSLIDDGERRPAVARRAGAEESPLPLPRSPSPPPVFDGVLSNFGGLNTINDWRPLAKALAGLVRPGGRLVLVPMGPLCPWEIGWHLLHGQWRMAWRRLGTGATAVIGQATIPISYPSLRRLQRDFAPWFRLRRAGALGLLLPPSYLDHLVDRWPRLFAGLDRLEHAVAPLLGGWGDHYLTVFERNHVNPPPRGKLRTAK